MLRRIMSFIVVRIILAALVSTIINACYFLVIYGIVLLFGVSFLQFMLNNDWAVIVWICIIATPVTVFSVSFVGLVWGNVKEKPCN